MIAVTHPGKIGDALYVLPTAKVLSQHYNCKVDFYTSNYCEPMRSLIECQPYINKMIVPEDYVIEKMDLGVQPRLMNITGKYEAVYQFGFKNVPDKALPEYIMESIGAPKELGSNIEYEYFSSVPDKLIDKKYIVLGSRGVTSFTNTFLKFIELSSYPVVVVGAKGQYIDSGIDCTDLDFEQMTSVIANSVGFVGLMSAPLVIANGFDIPKVIVHDGQSWDMRHVVHSQYSHYIVNPSPEQICNYFI